ncbi:hypothetical protein EF513_05420 [Rickettsiales endosymbiont of Stachyamoeba lipophora]|nr:hypothetical protein EF513_05420 [Rickettsiales endosymbiont of Stachyamoeba lipophora]
MAPLKIFTQPNTTLITVIMMRQTIKNFYQRLSYFIKVKQKTIADYGCKISDSIFTKVDRIYSNI